MSPGWRKNSDNRIRWVRTTCQVSNLAIIELVALQGRQEIAYCISTSLELPAGLLSSDFLIGRTHRKLSLLSTALRSSFTRIHDGKQGLSGKGSAVLSTPPRVDSLNLSQRSADNVGSWTEDANGGAILLVPS
jgi:hypothetical protein